MWWDGDSTVHWDLFPDASQTQQPNQVPGWLATATDHLIEIRRPGPTGEIDGRQYAGLNAYMAPTLYQE
jgi:hypothetical protein